GNSRLRADPDVAVPWRAGDTGCRPTVTGRTRTPLRAGPVPPGLAADVRAGRGCTERAGRGNAAREVGNCRAAAAGAGGVGRQGRDVGRSQRAAYAVESARRATRQVAGGESCVVRRRGRAVAAQKASRGGAEVASVDDHESAGTTAW